MVPVQLDLSFYEYIFAVLKSKFCLFVFLLFLFCLLFIIIIDFLFSGLWFGGIIEYQCKTNLIKD